MMMKKLSDDHYIVMDDSEIKIGDIVAEKLLTGKYELFTIHTLNDIDKSTQKKIIYSTQPLGFLNEHGFTTANLKPDWTNVEYLPLSEVKELLGVVDVEKKVMELYNNFKLKPFEAIYPLEGATKRFVENVYNQALEDNKEKKYTEEDLRKAISETRRGMLFLDKYVNEFIQSLQPKTEWEVEFVDGKLKLKL